jgi:hypothetical protein
MISTDFYALLGQSDRLADMKDAVEKEGYSAFRVLVDQLETALKQCEEGTFDDLAGRLAACEQLFPEPALFSPTWQNVWQELQTKLRWKRHAYETVPVPKREGEWQILMDNPFTNQEVVCYPGLSFVEASYLFGYFKPALEKTEYLRLQKIVTAVVETGNE